MGGVVKFARSSNLWDLANKKRPIGEYRIQNKKLMHIPDFKSKENLYITEYDRSVLKNFYQKKSQTLGDLLTINIIEGSLIISSLEKLVNLGLVKRDWEKEEEMHTDVVYSLTCEGEYIAQKKMPI